MKVVRPFLTTPTEQDKEQLEVETTAIATFASLINQRIIIVSDKLQHVAVDKHFFSKCLEPGLRQIYFDEEWYSTAYPDVAAAIQSGSISDARSHYVKYGYYEHRFPYAIKVDDAWYLAAYPDVSEAVGRGLFASAQDHFMEVGFREGRFPYPDFKLRCVGGP